MGQLLAIIGILIFLFVIFGLPISHFYGRQKKRKGAFEALSEQVKQQSNEKKNKEVLKGLNLIAALMGVVLGKAGVSWGIAILLTVGMMALIWLVSKIL